MSVFAEAMRQRIRHARAALAAARREGDDYGACVAEEELEDAVRLAREHGVEAGEEPEPS
ncbi:hypothetical protein ACFY1P_23945 [Streptomyces sp. NPDC001407]|uniref:hypothetical protein n=1 Tax=Streptomyces sp. NPDC001407 TaxID=3364573 RepID=UPI0036CFA11F